MIEKNLQAIGLSPSEIKTYLNLITNGASYPNKISADTGLNRTNVYEALDRLLKKGLVSFIIKNGVKWFEAKGIDSIYSILSDKQSELTQTFKNLESDLTILKKTIKKNSNLLEAKIFTGKKGLKLLLEDILIQKKQISVLGSRLQFKEIFGPYFQLWHKKRVASKIKQRSIFPSSMKNNLEKRPLLEYRFIDDKFANPTTTIIYGDSCLLIQWSGEPMAVQINNEKIAKSHQNYFDMLWKNSLKN